MSVQSVAKKFVEMCNQGKNFDVMKTMYHDDIASVEASGHSTNGKAAVEEITPASKQLGRDDPCAGPGAGRTTRNARETTRWMEKPCSAL